jgi:DNA-binding NtrC family response regulator
VVEDDMSIAEGLCEMLREMGCRPVHVTRGAAALSLATEQDFDVVLSDMVMPGELGGLDLARDFRARAIPVRVILMTGYSPAAQLARDEGFELLAKPFSFERLAAVMAGRAKLDDPRTDPS